MSFSLRAILGLDAAGFESGLLKSEQAAKASGKKIEEGMHGGGSDMFTHMTERIVGFEAITKAVAFLFEETEKAIEAAHELHAISQDTGASTEMLQVYQEAFDGTEKVTVAFKALAEARSKALGENGAGPQEIQTYQGYLQGLGVSIDDLKSKNMDQLFMQVGEQIKGAAMSGEELTNVAMVLGRSGVQMVDGFKRGLTDLHAEMNKKGEILSKEDIADLEEVHRSMDSLDRKTTMFFARSIAGWRNFFSIGIEAGTFDKLTHKITALDAYNKVQSNKAANDAEKQAAADAAHKSAAEKVAEINAKTAEIQYRQLSADEKRVILAQKRKDIEAQLALHGAAAAGDDAAKILAALLRQELAQVMADQNSVKPDKNVKAKEEAQPERMDVNAAQRVGAYAYQASHVDTAKKQLDTLGRIESTLNRIAAKPGVHF